MGHTIKEIGPSYIPQEILETKFFQECVANLPHLAGQNVDHAGVYLCEQKTGELIADRRIVRQHPQFKSLDSYINKTLHLKFEKAEDGIEFARYALRMLDAGKPMTDACRLAQGLQYAIAQSEHRSIRSLVAQEAPVEKPVETMPAERETIQVDAFVAEERVGPQLKQGFRRFSRDEVKALQGNCVQIWANHLVEDTGVSRERAQAEALKLLGSTGIDGKYGKNTNDLLKLVVGSLQRRGDLEGVSIANAKSLSKALEGISLRETIREFVRT